MNEKGIGSAAFMESALEDSSEAIAVGNSWKPDKRGEWLFGEVAAIGSHTFAARGDQPARRVRKFILFGKTGEVSARKDPETGKRVVLVPSGFDDAINAESYPVELLEDRAGVKACLAQPVTGANRRGVRVGDVILLRCLGKEGNTFTYGIAAAKPDKSRIPADALAEAQRECADDRGAAAAAKEAPAVDAGASSDDEDDGFLL